MSGHAVLHCRNVGTLRLPWWPASITRNGLSRSWTEVERPGRTPLLLAAGRILDEYEISYVARDADLAVSVADHVALLTVIARSKTPTQLTLAGDARGLFHVTNLSVVEIDHTAGGRPANVDVSLTLKRASDATVNVGPVPRKRHKRPTNKKGR